MATPKNDYWLNSVWGQHPYRVPGEEGLVLPSGNTGARPHGVVNGIDHGPFPGHLRYNTDDNRLEAYVNFQWETVVSGDVSTVATVDTTNDLPPAPQNDGALAVVLDDGDGHELLFVWNNTNTDLGSPIVKWRLLSTTELFSSAVVYRNQVITDLAMQNIGSAFLTLFNPYVKEINVTIVEAFDAGRTMFIQESGGAILMDSSLINPQLVGTYQLQIPDSTNVLDGISDDWLLDSTGQVQANIGGGSGSGGKAVVFIKTVTLLEESP